MSTSVKLLVLGTIATALSSLAALPTSPSHAASFDCTKASRPAEKLICQDSEISTLDEYLDRYFRAAGIALGRGVECLRAEQLEWLSQVRNRCPDRDCLRRVYLERLSQLDGLQPGATTLRNIDLPEGPQLFGILPPAEDEIAAPRDTDSRPAEIRGSIIDDVESGDGFVLQDGQGKSFLLRPLMFLEPEDATLLGAAAKETQSTFLVRGFLVEDDESSLAFDVSRCTYVFRLPPAAP
jgi:uncharacterized protein